MRLSEIGIAMGEEKVAVNALFDAKTDLLIKKTGIPYVFETRRGTVELALEAVGDLMQKRKSWNDPQALMLVTQSPDDYLPANSITLTAKLNLPSSLLTFDFNQGCSGFVQALSVADSMLAKHENILLVTADRYRQKLDPVDRSTRAVFSDGASAVLLRRSSSYKIFLESHKTFGEYRNLLYQSTSKTENGGRLHMAGADIWLFTASHVVPQIQESLDKCTKDGLKVKKIYLHQASRLVVDGIAAKLQCDPHLIAENYATRGNTVSSTIPILMNDFPPPSLEPNEVILLAGFGVGLTSSVVVYGRSK